MSTRIAHLSDLHYRGRGFDPAQWQAVAKVIADFRPHLIIVSGDLVDHPDLARLEEVKAELVKL
jgi:predicted MPP superfamily phosphohydrolase